MGLWGKSNLARRKSVDRRTVVAIAASGAGADISQIGLVATGGLSINEAVADESGIDPIAGVLIANR
ncbi:hypothetical protein CWM47_07315 [Spirosoma pollinicola]|uniref:Uncharacterized protein n=1 Tax=Spirosoma pollinicola TaxID=2057025 RepID=A0A2K8YVN8_9BACT|nr:hypothetical protein CWM47_07315 [Spirosoma pollinicola]